MALPFSLSYLRLHELASQKMEKIQRKREMKREMLVALPSIYKVPEASFTLGF